MTIDYPIREPLEVINIINNPKIGVTEKKKQLKDLGVRLVEVIFSVSNDVLELILLTERILAIPKLQRLHASVMGLTACLSFRFIWQASPTPVAIGSQGSRPPSEGSRG